MLELRYTMRRREVPLGSGFFDLVEEKVLQYRVKLIDTRYESGWHWSDWQDVPTVSEEEL